MHTVVVFDRIRHGARFEDLLRSYQFEFERRGNDLLMSCPFRCAKAMEPMVIYPTANRFFCFCCGENGDAIDFVVQLEGLELRTAALIVARRCGVSAS